MEKGGGQKNRSRANQWPQEEHNFLRFSSRGFHFPVSFTWMFFTGTTLTRENASRVRHFTVRNQTRSFFETIDSYLSNGVMWLVRSVNDQRRHPRNPLPLELRELPVPGHDHGIHIGYATSGTRQTVSGGPTHSAHIPFHQRLQKVKTVGGCSLPKVTWWIDLYCRVKRNV